MAHKTPVGNPVKQQNKNKASLAELGLVLFVFVALLLTIVALSQALSAYHSVHHTAHEGPRSAITRVATQDFSLAAPRPAISLGPEAGRS